MPTEGPEKVRLPWRQLLSLMATNFGQAVMLTTPFTIAVYMVRDFLEKESGSGTADEQAVGRMTGLLAAVFSFAQFVTALLWGAISNRIGRKPVVVLGNIVSYVSFLWFGLSPNYSSAIASRVFGGFFNGIIGAWKCMIGESADTFTQGKMFGWMSLAWGMGTIAGPTVGGLLARPCDHYKGLSSCAPGEVMRERPYFLACLVASSSILIATFLSIFLLAETLPSKVKQKQNSATGDSIASKLKRFILRINGYSKLPDGSLSMGASTESKPTGHRMIPEHDAAASSMVLAAMLPSSAGKTGKGEESYSALHQDVHLSTGRSAVADISVASPSGCSSSITALCTESAPDAQQPRSSATLAHDASGTEQSTRTMATPHTAELPPHHLPTADSYEDLSPAQSTTQMHMLSLHKDSVVLTHGRLKEVSSSQHLSSITEDEDCEGQRLLTSFAVCSDHSTIQNEPPSPMQRMRHLLSLSSRVWVRHNPFQTRTSSSLRVHAAGVDDQADNIRLLSDSTIPSDASIFNQQETQGSMPSVTSLTPLSASHVHAANMELSPVGPASSGSEHVLPADTCMMKPTDMAQASSNSQSACASAVQMDLLATTNTSSGDMQSPTCQPLPHPPSAFADPSVINGSGPVHGTIATSRCYEQQTQQPGFELASEHGAGRDQQRNDRSDAGQHHACNSTTASESAVIRPSPFATSADSVGEEESHRAQPLSSGYASSTASSKDGLVEISIHDAGTTRKPELETQDGISLPGKNKRVSWLDGYRRSLDVSQDSSTWKLWGHNGTGRRRDLSEKEAGAWYHDKAIVMTVLGYGVCCLLFVAVDEVLPLFASAPTDHGGLGMTESQLAIPLIVYGAVLMAYSVWGFPALQRNHGTVAITRWGLLATIVTCIMIPMSASALPNDGLSNIVLYSSMVVKGFSQSSAFTGAIILVNAAPLPSQLGTVNGVGQTLAAFTRGVGPALGGILWAASLSLHSPGQQFLTFCVVAVIAMAAWALYRYVNVGKK